MKKIYLLFLLLLSGCATFSHGYIPSVTKKITQEDGGIKKDITFSVLYRQEILDDGVISQNDFKNKLKKVLKESGLFNKVHYVESQETESNNHFIFSIFITGTSPSNREIAKGFQALTLGLIPTKKDYNIDFVMSHHVKGKNVYKEGIAEQVTDFYWLPVIVLTPFLNHGTVGYCVEKNAAEYFVNQIIENKLY